MHSTVVAHSTFPTPTLPLLETFLTIEGPKGDAIRATVPAYHAAADALDEAADAVEAHPSTEALKAAYRAEVRAALETGKREPKEPNYILNEERGRQLERRYKTLFLEARRAAKAVDTALADAHDALRAALTPMLSEAAEQAPEAVQRANQALARLEGLTGLMRAVDLLAAHHTAETEGLNVEALRQAIHDADREARDQHYVTFRRAENYGEAVNVWNFLPAYSAALAAVAEARLPNPLNPEVLRAARGQSATRPSDSLVLGTA